MRRHRPVSIKEVHSVHHWKNQAHQLIDEIQMYGKSKNWVYGELARRLGISGQDAHISKMVTMEQVFRAVKVLEAIRASREQTHLYNVARNRKAERRLRHEALLAEQARGKAERLLARQKANESRIESNIPHTDIPRVRPIPNLVHRLWDRYFGRREVLDPEGEGTPRTELPTT